MEEIQVTPKLKVLERAVSQMPQASCPVVHTFHNGVYMRQVTIPAGAVAIGHCQRFEHINIFLKGKVTVVNEDGSKTTLEAPLTFIGEPGRKCGYIHEEVVWINVYKTNITDVAEAEAYFLDKSLSEPVPQAADDTAADHTDFQLMLADLGVDAETVRMQAEDQSDMVDFPAGSYKCAVFDSHIEGKGLFATGDFLAGELIAPTRIGDMRTPAGRYINHSAEPNSEMVEINGAVYARATRDISGCRASLLGEEITMDYRKNVVLARRLACQG